MDIENVTRDVAFQLGGMIAAGGKEYKVFALDIGEVYLKTEEGEFFKLTVEQVSKEDIDFLDGVEWN